MRGFLLILAAGLACAVLGGGVGWLIGSAAPEFVVLVARPQPVDEPHRLGAALGLVSGLLLGVGAMAFGLLVEAFRAWILRGRTGLDLSDEPSRQATPPGHRLGITAAPHPNR